jgi:YHS domain-containing protein
MKLFAKMATIVASLGLVISVVAADKTEPSKTAAKATAPQTLKNQSLCPVMGDEIDTTQYLDIQGQRVFFCCKKCEAKMKADPDKYFQKAAEEHVLFKNIQTSCPVSGKPIDTTVFTDYQGRRLFFCCDKCPVEFAKDPQKYLLKMDAVPANPAK